MIVSLLYPYTDAERRASSYRITQLESDKPESAKDETVEDEPAEGAFAHGDVGKINIITTDEKKEEGGKEHE